MTLDEAKKLAVKILSKTLDATKLTADKGIVLYLNYIFENLLDYKFSFTLKSLHNRMS